MFKSGQAGTMRYGVQLDDGRYGPATSTEVMAENLLTAWILANRQHNPSRDGTRVMIVFSLEPGNFDQAMRLDYSTTSGKGDPHG